MIALFGSPNINFHHIENLQLHITKGGRVKDICVIPTAFVYIFNMFCFVSVICFYVLYAPTDLSIPYLSHGYEHRSISIYFVRQQKHGCF